MKGNFIACIIGRLFCALKSCRSAHRLKSVFREFIRIVKIEHLAFLQMNRGGSNYKIHILFDLEKMRQRTASLKPFTPNSKWSGLKLPWGDKSRSMRYKIVLAKSDCPAYTAAAAPIIL